MLCPLETSVFQSLIFHVLEITYFHVFYPVFQLLQLKKKNLVPVILQWLQMLLLSYMHFA